MANIFDDRLRDFIKYIRDERQYSHHTAKAYEKDLTDFNLFIIEYYGSSINDYNSVDKLGIRHYLGKNFEEGASPRTVARRLASIKSYFKYLFQTNFIQKNPSIHVKTPKIGRKLPSFINDKVMDTLLGLPDQSTPKGLRDKSIMELFYATGIRLSELVNLNVGDINFNQNLIRVRGKGNKERIVPFGNAAHNAIKEYGAKYGISFDSHENQLPIFCSVKGKRISVRTIQNRINGYLTQVTVGERLGPHILRHSFATAMIDHGADIRAVQEFLGHASLSSTQIYTHIKPEKLKEAFKKSHPHGS